MSSSFKRVPAIDKCLQILEALYQSREPLGVSDLLRQLDLNKSTVFNIVHTLADLEILEKFPSGKFHFGNRLYLLGNAAGKRSELIHTVHPFLAKINAETKLSAFLGIRSGLQAVILDKVDTAYDIRISSDVGMRLPLIAGAGGKALLSQLTDEDIDQILSRNGLRSFTNRTCTDKAKFKKRILETRRSGIASDLEEYIEGIVAYAVPITTNRPDLVAAIWAVGLRQQVDADKETTIRDHLLQVADEVNQRFSP